MSIAWPDFAAALGLLLIVEGILPFLNPAGIRRALSTIAALDDRVLRVTGAACMLAGLLILWLVRS